MKEYTLFWNDGRLEVLEGDNPQMAMIMAGYGSVESLHDLRFWLEGDYSDKYEWHAESHQYRWKNQQQS